MKPVYKNLLSSLTIIAFIVLIILSLDDSNGMVKAVIYTVGALVFSFAGLISLLMVLMKRMNTSSIFYLTTMIVNLLFVIVLINEFDVNDANTLEVGWCYPIVVGVVELVIFIRRYRAS